MSVCAYSLDLTFFLVHFSMTFTRGSGSSSMGMHGISDEEIRQIIATEVAIVVRQAIPKVYGSIKAMMIKMFDDHYATVTEANIAIATIAVVTARFYGGDLMRYRESTT